MVGPEKVIRSHKPSPVQLVADGNAEWRGASPGLSDVLLGLLGDGGSRGQAFGRLFGLP